MSVDQKLPVSDASVEWTKSTGTYNYQNVDDPIGSPDDDSTYNYTPSNQTVYTDIFGTTALAVPTGATISKVSAYLRAKEMTGAGGGVVEAALIIGGSNYWSGNLYIGSGAWNGVYFDWTTNPATGNPWTVNQVNAIQGVAYRKNNAGYNTLVRATQIYVEATYTVPQAYTLTAGAGSYSKTGQTAGLRAARKIAAGIGSLSISGQLAQLRATRRLAAGPGSYSLTGQPVALHKGRTLSAGAGSYLLTGYPASLVYPKSVKIVGIDAISGKLVYLTGKLWET